MNNFQSRLLIGALYVLITVSAVVFDVATSALFFLLIQGFCLAEFYKIAMGGSWKHRAFPLLVGTFIFTMVLVNQNENINAGYYVFWIIPLMLTALIFLIIVDEKVFIKNATAAVFGWIYISAALGIFARVGHLSFDPDNKFLLYFNGRQILVIFIMIWANDTFAYLVGKKWGKYALAPRISPKKTWEGFAGGLLGTMALTLVLAHFFAFLPLKHFAILALIVVIFGNLGDLFESKIKRALGIKDSGTALGGHGGFLDRFDSILFAGPACYFYLYHFAVM